MTHTNGALKDFRAQDLLNKVKEYGCAVNSVREHGDDKYVIIIRAHGIVCVLDENTEYMVDVIVEHADGSQEDVTNYAEYSHLKESELVEKLDALVQNIVGQEEDTLKVDEDKIQLITNISNQCKHMDGYDTGYSINREHKIWRDNSPIEFGVNWSARGTQSPEEALRIAKRLAEGANFAKRLNDLRIVEVRSEKGIFDNEEDYTKACYWMADAFKKGSFGAVIVWLQVDTPSYKPWNKKSK